MSRIFPLRIILSGAIACSTTTAQGASSNEQMVKTRHKKSDSPLQCNRSLSYCFLSIISQKGKYFCFSHALPRRSQCSTWLRLGFSSNPKQSITKLSPTLIMWLEPFTIEDFSLLTTLIFTLTNPIFVYPKTLLP